MSNNISRRRLFATFVAAALASLAGKLNAACGRWRHVPKRDAAPNGAKCENDRGITVYIYDSAGNLIGVQEPREDSVTSYVYHDDNWC